MLSARCWDGSITEFIRKMLKSQEKNVSMVRLSFLLSGSRFPTLLRATDWNFIFLKIHSRFFNRSCGTGSYIRSRRLDRKRLVQKTIVSLLNLRLFRCSEVPVLMNEREHGESSITFSKSVYYMIKVTMAMLLARIGGGYTANMLNIWLTLFSCNYFYHLYSYYA